MLRQVGVVLLLLLGSSSGSKRQHEDMMHSFIHDLDVNQDVNDIESDAESDFTVELYYKPPAQNDFDQVEPLSITEEPVSRLWGVPDTTATVGTLFSMAVPKDAFQGDVKYYQLKSVPSWLHWDGHRHVLEGVARPADRGHHYITIKAVGADGTKAKDVFSVDVTEMSSKKISRVAGCSKKVDLTVASIVIDKSVAAMDAKTRVRTIRAASKFLGIKRVSLKSTVQDLDPLDDDAAILIGPGSSTHLGRGDMSQIQWVVGCGGEISSSYQGTVDRVEATAKDGTLEQAINVPVLGWTVVQVHAKTRRVRRQTDYSGDSNYDDYSNSNNDDDYWNIDYDALDYGPVDGDDDYDEEYEDYEGYDYDPVVPNKVEPSATPYPAPDSRPDYVSMRPVPTSTPVYVPVKPTRVVSIEASPTVAQPTYKTTYPLESSITTQPINTVEATAPLGPSTVSEFNPTAIVLPDHVTEMVYTETEVKNFPPKVNQPIPRLSWIAGHVYRMVIPENTFHDVEDGSTRKLKLVFKKGDGQNVGYASWIQFDSKNQEIYALPLEDNIGHHYVFYLEAIDSEDKSTTFPINIHVKQAKAAQNYNHKITTTFKLSKKADYELMHQLDWQVKAVEKLAALYGDETAKNINILAIFNKPHQISWTDVSTHPHSQSCPEEKIKDLLQVLVKDEVDMEPNAKAKKAFEPEFVIKKVNVEWVGNCRSYEPDPVMVVDNVDKAAVDQDASSEPPFNQPPHFQNPIDYLNATQGQFFINKLNVDTCYDLEEGDINNLNMRLFTHGPSPVHAKNWLQFDPEKKEFYGIPLETDVGQKKYILECSDSGGKKVNDELTVNVQGRDDSEEPVVEFQIVIQHMSYDDFMSNSRNKKQLIEKIAEALEDRKHKMVVKSLSQGSVVVTWYNSSLVSEHHESCPSDEIKDISEKIFDDNGELLRSFKTALIPFDVTSGSVNPLGMCFGVYKPAHKPLEKIAPVQEDEGDDYLLNFIIPAIIIAIMLLLAAIIACCLYRRRRYGKMDMTDDHTFVSKGIPIIFAEELDDRPDPAKSPMLMKDEKQPLPPPEYTRGNTLPASTPPNGERMRPQSGDQSPYQPPPAFPATNGTSRNQRPNMTPQYRKPPTYVPP